MSPVHLLLLFSVWATLAKGAELLTLTPDNVADTAPQGKESDAIIGDYVLRNDRIVCAIADPRLMMGRSASRWAIPNVAGAVLDLNRRNIPQDVLTAFYPALPRFKPDAPNYQHEFIEETVSCRQPDRQPVSAPRVTLEMPAYEIETGVRLEEIQSRPPHLRTSPRPYIEVRYTLEDGWDFLEVETLYVNPTPTPFPFTPSLSLRVDDPCQAGLHFNNRLFWIYEPWWGQAIGVWSPDHAWTPQGIRPPRHPLTPIPPAPSGWILPPQGRIRFVHRLVPAANLFDLFALAAPWAGEPTRSLAFHLTAPDGPVANAYVRLFQHNLFLGAGRTDSQGSLQLTGPAKGPWTLRVEPFGRPAVEITRFPELLPAEQLELSCSPAARLRLSVQDDAGNSLPARVTFRGLKETPTPFFFPPTGEFHVQNILQRHDGHFDEIIPPGQYQVVVSHGPEYHAEWRNLLFTEGETIAWTCTLRRAYSTPGWISADWHNHATRSGISEIFYVYPYSKCPTVDGDSTASPLGRVLGLLASDVRFAVLTDHNYSGTFQPELDRLDVGDRLKTCPGIGFTAGRRHTTTHQNVFPIRHIPGRQDGGVPQRPEHVGQLAWIRSWDSHQERLFLIAVPRNQPLEITTGMDALDLQDLEPLVEGKPMAGRDNRVLDWIAALNEGYRFPATLSSGTFDNATGVGARRTYVAGGEHFADPNLSETLVRAVRNGRAIMTTGPFLSVELIAEDQRFGPGDSAALRDGQASLHVRLLTSNLAAVHKVQVLINGKRTPSLIFTPQTHPSFFAPPPYAFTATVPLSLDEDAHLIVVASGPGFSWLEPSAQNPLEERTHIAVSNPIWVDVGGDGYSPRSPLLDAVRTSLDFLLPPLAVTNTTEPGLVRVTLHNLGEEYAEGRLTLEVVPSDAAILLDLPERVYRLAPSEQSFFDWPILLSPSLITSRIPLVSTYHNTATFGLRVRRGPPPSRHRPSQTFMQLDYPLRSLPPIDRLEDIDNALADSLSFPLTSRERPTPVGQARWAVSGSNLVFAIQVVDPNPRRAEVAWEGSCVEVFGSLPGRSSQNKPEMGFFPIRQVYLLPAVGSEPAMALYRKEDTIRPAPEITLNSAPLPTGYQIHALIPLPLLGTDVDYLPRALFFSSGFQPVTWMGLDPRPGRILLEVRATLPQPPPKPPVRFTVFGSRAPHVDHNNFGRFRLRGDVEVRSQVLHAVKMSEPNPNGMIILTLSNASPQRISDVLAIRSDHAKCGIADQPTTMPLNIPFALNPHEQRTIALTIQPTPGLQAAWIELQVPRSPFGAIAGIPLFRLPVMDFPLPRKRSPPLPEWQIPREGRPIATVRLAFDEEGLWVLAQVKDKRVVRGDPIWKGSCLELFASSPDRPDRIHQIFLLPPKESEKPFAAISEDGQPLSAPDIPVTGQPTPEGYEMTALIPLHRLGLSTIPDRIHLELQLAVADEENALHWHTAFGSPRAYQSSIGYGAFRVLPP